MTDAISFEVSRIERALMQLLEVLEADAAINPPPTTVSPEVRFRALARAHRETDTDKLIRHPVAMACRIGIRMLGQRLCEIYEGDVDKVMDMAERAADGPNKLERMVVIVNQWKPLLDIILDDEAAGISATTEL